MTRKNQRGSALLVVLLILSVMVIVSTNITVRYNSEFLRTANVVNGMQAKWYARGSEALVRRVINQDLSDNGSTVNLSQYWASTNRSMELDGGSISGEISDLFSCFNLNALSNHGYDFVNEQGERESMVQEAFMRLLTSLMISETEAAAVTSSIADMVDSDDEITNSDGAEDPYYRSRAHPFVVPNGFLYDVSEIRTAKGMTPSIYRRIKPFVCTLQSSQLKINVNTLTTLKAPLLAAIMIDDSFTVDQAITVIENREHDGWPTARAFLDQDEIKNSLTNRSKNFVTSVVSVTTNYFKSRSQVEYNGLTQIFNTYFVRNGLDVKPYRREYGGAE